MGRLSSLSFSRIYLAFQRPRSNYQYASTYNPTFVYYLNTRRVFSLLVIYALLAGFFLCPLIPGSSGHVQIPHHFSRPLDILEPIYLQSSMPKLCSYPVSPFTTYKLMLMGIVHLLPQP